MKHFLLASVVVLFCNSLSAAVLRHNSNPVQGVYIVGLRPGVGDPATVAAQLVKIHGGNIRHVLRGKPYEGFTLNNLPEPAAEALSRDPRIDFVEEAGAAHLLQWATNFWALDRLNQRTAVLDNILTDDCNKGFGVFVYVMDSGVNNIAAEFGTRLVNLYTKAPNNFADGSNHGTPVASIIGGNTRGVARGVTLLNVKVISNSGDSSEDAIVAIRDWINPHAQANPGPKVVNMSLIYDAPIDQTVSALRDEILNSMNTYNIAYVVGAGNGNTRAPGNVTGIDACTAGPPADMGQTLGVITVGATSLDRTQWKDYRSNHPNGDGIYQAWGSNYGACVDIFAPGTLVEAIDFNGNGFLFSGTSAATPYVAGIAARHGASYWTSNGTAPSAAYIENTVKTFATSGVIDSATLGANSPNMLAFQFAARCR